MQIMRLPMLLLFALGWIGPADAVTELRGQTASGAYYIANLRAQAWSCRTHLPPFTAMRGFGGPQAMLALEAAQKGVSEAAAPVHFPVG